MSQQAYNQTGFPFYETLRYFLPGLIFISMLIILIKDFKIESSDVSLALLLSLIIGFPIHSFAPYKRIPTIDNLRKKFHKKLINIVVNNWCNEIPFNLKLYIALDLLSLAMSNKEYSISRRYYSLGALKLDVSFFMLITLPLIMVKLYLDFNYIYIIVTILFLYFSIILIDDGKNDLVRAFNMFLIISRKNIKIIELYKNAFDCKDLIIYERRRLYKII